MVYGIVLSLYSKRITILFHILFHSILNSIPFYSGFYSRNTGKIEIYYRAKYEIGSALGYP